MSCVTYSMKHYYIHSLNPERFQLLIDKYLSNTASDEEIRQLEQWYYAYESERDKYAANQSGNNQSGDQELYLDNEIHLENQIWESIQAKVENTERPERQLPFRHVWFKSSSVKRWQIAAAILLILCVSGIGLHWLQKPDAIVYTQVQNPAGKRTVVSLPDGSKVYLNAASSLRYPVQFSGTTREVYLEGEAFFEVRKNPDKPFLVKSGQVQTKVLGTGFNVKAYPNEEKTEVAVIHGKVSVTDSSSQVFLTPHQKAVYHHKTGKLSQETFQDLQAYQGWITGQLVFEKTSVGEIVATLNRHYDVSIELSDTRMGQCILKARFDNKPLSEVLTVLCTYLGARYKQNGRKIMIHGNGC